MYVFQPFKPVATLKGHTDIVNVIGGITFTYGDTQLKRTIIVTASVDSSIKMWNRSQNKGKHNTRNC